MSFTIFDYHGLLTEVQALDSTFGVPGNTTMQAAPQEGLQYDHISLTSTDTVAHVVTLAVNDGSGTEAICGSVTVPPGAGTDGVTAQVIVLDASPGIGTPIPLQWKAKLVLRWPVGITAGKVLGLVASGGFF